MPTISKKWKFILIILFVFIVCVILFVYFSNYNVKQVSFDNVENICINFFKDTNDYPLTTIVLSDFEEDEILNELKDWKFIKYDNLNSFSSNFEVILNDKTKFTFNYKDYSFSWFYNDSNNYTNFFNSTPVYPVYWYSNDEIFITKLPISILSKIVHKVNSNLITQAKKFETDKITINFSTKSVSVTDKQKLEVIFKELKYIMEIDKLPDTETKYLLDFHNGIKLQIFDPLEFDENGSITTGKVFGKILFNEQSSKNIEIPHSLIYEIYDLI